MGKKEISKDEERATYRARAVLKSLGELEPDLLDDLSIGAEQELATREEMESGELLIDLTTIADKISDAEKDWGKVSGLSTGFPSLDAAIGGLKRGELILIGGKPKNGKTALAQNIATQVAKQHRVLFITLELLAEQTGVRVKHINGGVLPDPGHFMVQAKHRMDYRHIKPMFEQAKQQGVELVVLDYLQFLGRGMTNDEVAKMSKEMKTLALEFELPFIVIVSLRKGETKFTSKWTDIELDDITGTAAIGYDADAILVASRRDPEGEKDPDHLYVKVVEIRSMPDTKEILKFKWDRTRISEEHTYDWVPEDKDITEVEEEVASLFPTTEK
jgi:replicative DNA helicase